VGREGFELTIRHVVDRFGLVPQVLLLLTRRSLPLADSECVRSEVLLLPDGGIALSFGCTVHVLGVNQQLLGLSIKRLSNSLLPVE
jgi:hypothetical protein